MLQRVPWRRVHSVSGLFPLGAYLVFHAWEHAPVREGRDPLFARLLRTQHAVLEFALVLFPLVVHAWVGLKLAREPDSDRVYLSPAFRRLQVVTGVLAAPFIAYHLAGVWLPRLREPNPIGAAYDGMLDHTADLAGVALYALGLAAVCIHFGQGLGAALTRVWPRRIGHAAARIVGIAAGILLWLTLLNELASYATSAPLL